MEKASSIEGRAKISRRVAKEGNMFYAAANIFSACRRNSVSVYYLSLTENGSCNNYQNAFKAQQSMPYISPKIQSKVILPAAKV